MEKEKALKELGLSDKEIKVFLSSLELGQATVNDIARKSNTFRTYCYDLLKTLMEKGLVNYLIKSGVKYYETVEPERLVEILKEKEENIKSIVFELKEIRGKSTEKPKVEFYEGKEGIKAIYNEIIRSKPTEVLVYGNTGKQEEIMQWYFTRYIKERIKLKIKTRVITEKSEQTQKEIQGKDKEELRETKFFPKGFTFPTIKYIYKNKIAMISLGKNLTGVVIENKELVEGETEAFEILWKTAEK